MNLHASGNACLAQLIRMAAQGHGDGAAAQLRRRQRQLPSKPRVGSATGGSCRGKKDRGAFPWLPRLKIPKFTRDIENYFGESWLDGLGFQTSFSAGH